MSVRAKTGNIFDGQTPVEARVSGYPWSRNIPWIPF